MDFHALKKFCTSDGILQPTGILEALRTVQSRVCCASRYHSLVPCNQEIKEDLANILGDTSRVLSERVVTDLDNWYGLKLTNKESTGAASSNSAQSPTRTHAHTGSPQPAASF